MTGRNETVLNAAIEAESHNVADAVPSPDPYLQELTTLDLPATWSGAVGAANRALEALDATLNEIKAHNARMRVLMINPWMEHEKQLEADQER